MRSEDMFFEAAKKRIAEWIEEARANIDYNRTNGWGEDEIDDEMVDSHRELVNEIRKLEFFIEDTDRIEDLTYFAEQAFENAEDYIWIQEVGA